MNHRDYTKSFKDNDPRTESEKERFPFHVELSRFDTTGRTWGIYQNGEYVGPEADDENKESLSLRAHAMNVEHGEMVVA